MLSVDNIKSKPSEMDLVAIEIAEAVVAAVPLKIIKQPQRPTTIWNYTAMALLISKLKNQELECLVWEEVCFLLS